MSTLGKVFLVIVLVESIAFSVFSLALFSKRITWRELYIDHIGKKNEDITESKGKIKTLEGQNNALDEKNKTLIDEVAAAKKEVGLREADIKKKDEEIGQKQTKINNLEGEVKKKDDDILIRTELNAKLEKDIGGLTTKLATTEAERKNYSEKMSEAVMEKEKYKTAARISEKRVQLLETETGILRQQVDYCTKNHKQFDVGVIKQVEKISGFVTAVFPDNQGLIMIDKGVKDGVTPNMEFIVYRDIRGGIYIGKIRIIEVYDNMAAGVIITIAPDKKVQSGDEVTTKLE